MLFQPSNISPSEVNGTAAVDLNQDLDITWQVNGNSPMYAYQITIYDNTPVSTQKYTTGKVSLDTPFWGINYAGDTQFFTVTITAANLASHSISNNNEYKFTIKQWWSTSDTDNVEQTTASLFIGRTTPSVAITAITSPLQTYAYSFTGTYTQTQNDPLKWVRWMICAKDSDGKRQTPFVDTGEITGTGELRVNYSGFLNNTSYSIMLTVQTINGMEATSGWVDFSVAYTVAPASGGVTASQLADGSVLVIWEQILSAQGYDVFRRTVGSDALEKITSVGNTVGEIRDYSVRSGKSYIWYVFPTGILAYKSAPMMSNELAVQFWFWNITEAQKNADGSYVAVNNYIFKYGSGGVKEGNFSNNNNPEIQKNFTRYPTRQPDSSNYLTGSVSGLVGTIGSDRTYKDTLEQARALRELSTTENDVFLRDPKGHFIKIQTSSPVTMSINHKSREMPQTVTVPWVEIDDVRDAKITLNATNAFWPVDNIIFTTVRVDPETGILIWNRDANYANGSTLKLVNGVLTQTVTDGYTPAQMSINDNDLTATLTEL